MQRRVAAIYLVFFVVMGASAYSVIALADQPAVDVPNGETYANGTTLTVGGQEYTVIATVEESGDGHGGTDYTPAASLSYVNDSAVQTAAWENGSTVSYLGDEYDVRIDNASGTVRLVESIDVAATLANDSAVFNETVVVNGTESVTYREDNRNRPLDEYLAEQYPDRETFSFSEGDSVDYDNQSTTLTAITSEEATLTWTASERQSVELSDGGNVTLAGGNTYFAHFDTEGSGADLTLDVMLAPSSDYGAYSGDLSRQSEFKDRMNGLWGIIILASVAALLVVSLAYMPVRG
ncbi:hypothetical protein [Halosegnis marinus]|uniref:DUF4178 domain-containing protein n=1 Tax=Halosegnis marinus TaxID=3034023 RepID=A0ABD5ZNL8_9EURY|nr:hypothetical protein [Halosegnis sp. DT85]